MKYALIIGNDKYDDPKLAQLKTPAADSQALAKALADKSIGSFDEVTPLINKTETEIRRAISGFLTSKKPDDLVLVYFSGHGVLDDRGRLFLSLKDTQTNLLKATAIPSSYIADEMDTCRSKRQILILDCCHSGAFARGTKGDQKAVTEATFEGSGFGRVVLTASDSTQYALEGDQVITQTDLSLFTHFLLEGLSTGEADQNNDGFISLDEWYDYTYTRVISTTPKQVPHKWSYHQQGDLLIAKNPFVKKRVVELPKEMLAALESPFASIREGAVKELGKYLNSKDLDTVELARETLKKMKSDDSRVVSEAAESLLKESNVPEISKSSEIGFNGPVLTKPNTNKKNKQVPKPQSLIKTSEAKETTNTLIQDINIASKPFRQRFREKQIEYSKSIVNLIFALPFWVYFLALVIKNVLAFDRQVTSEINVTANYFYGVTCFLILLYGVNKKGVTVKSLKGASILLVGFVILDGLISILYASSLQNYPYYADSVFEIYNHKSYLLETFFPIVFVVSLLLATLILLSDGSIKNVKLLAMFVWFMWQCAYSLLIMQNEWNDFLFYIVNCFIGVVATIIFIPRKASQSNS